MREFPLRHPWRSCDAKTPWYYGGVTTKQLIHEIVDSLSDEAAEDLLLQLQDETEAEYSEEFLARIEEGRAAIRRGDFVTREEFERKYLGDV